MKTFILLTLIPSFWLAACGSSDDQEGSELSAESDEEEAVSISEDGKDIKFSGFVLNAFEVEVDGVNYPDLEVFYTEELGRLPQKAIDAGFEGWDIDFEAEVGFRDLWREMSVYIAADDTRGYQGEGLVESDGRFEVSFPYQANLKSYRVRANKRITLVLKRESEIKRICYNFSAKDLQVELDGEKPPIILDRFTTQITKYKCHEQSGGSGIEVPDYEQPAQEIGVIKKGFSKGEVLDLVNHEGLTMAPNIWCWGAEDRHKNCEVFLSEACQCALYFDDSGKVYDQFNMSKTLMGSTNW